MAPVSGQRRGGGWVAVQGMLLLAIAVSLSIGPQLGALRMGRMIVGAVLALSGAVLAAVAIASHPQAVSATPAPVRGRPLVEDGIYGLVRHPIYGGVAIACAGLAVFTGRPLALLASLVLAIFFSRKAAHEESLLERAYPQYADYAARVPRRMIPWVW